MGGAVKAQRFEINCQQLLNHIEVIALHFVWPSCSAMPCAGLNALLLCNCCDYNVVYLLALWTKGLWWYHVRLDPSRPLSKRKHWVVAEILKKARIYVPPSADSSVGLDGKTEAQTSAASWT